MMQAQNEENKKNIIQKLEKNLSDIEQTKSNINKITNSLEKHLPKIQQQTKEVKENVRKLQEQAIILGISKEELPAIPTKHSESKSESFKQSVSIIASTINFINTAKNWITTLFKENFSKTKDQKKEKLSNKQSQELESIKKQIAKLEKEKSKITKKRILLTDKKDKRFKKAQKTKQQISEGNALQESSENKTEKSKLRKEIEDLFSNFLNLMSWSIKKGTKYSKTAYENIIKKNTTEFIASVQKRVKELNKIKTLKKDEKLPPAELVSEK